MRYFRDPETGQIFAYEDDDDDSVILPQLVALSQAEINELLSQKERDEQQGREAAWVISELAIVSEQLLMHEDEDDMAVATPEAWREYRKALRRWNEVDSEDFPDQEKRPKRPE